MSRITAEVCGLDHVEHGEQQIAVFLDLRSLMTVARVLDRERMQVDFACINSSARASGSSSATQTKQSGLTRYRWMSCGSMSSSRCPF
jgi:hypothetical protein